VNDQNAETIHFELSGITRSDPDNQIGATLRREVHHYRHTSRGDSEAMRQASRAKWTSLVRSQIAWSCSDSPFRVIKSKGDSINKITSRSSPAICGQRTLFPKHHMICLASTSLVPASLGLCWCFGSWEVASGLLGQWVLVQPALWLDPPVPGDLAPVASPCTSTSVLGDTWSDRVWTDREVVKEDQGRLYGG
jgi:hypothetical protein